MQTKLLDIGLSENQSKLYLCLRASGELRVHQLTQLTAIPRASAYDSLNILLSIGLVEKLTNENHSIYKARTITSMTHSITDQMKNLENIMLALPIVESEIGQLSHKSKALGPSVKLYKDKSGVRQIFWNTLNAKTTVYVLSEFSRSKYLGEDFYKNFVEVSLKRKIKEQVITNLTPEVISTINRDNNTALARTYKENIRVLNSSELKIVGETFIYDNVHAQVFLKNDNMYGFEIESSDFVLSQRNIFINLWNKARKQTHA
jgi:sugar-specific transcriptional regulator TrmB